MNTPLTPGVTIRFLVTLVLFGVVLWILPFDGDKVGRYRLDNALKNGSSLAEPIAAQCSDLQSLESGPTEKLLVEALKPRTLNPKGSACELSVVTTRDSRFELSVIANYRFAVNAAGGSRPLLERDFTVTYPLPLAFLPMFAMVIAVVLGFRAYSLPLAIALQIFTLSGGNLIESFENAATGIALSAQKDTNLIGLLLTAAWLALYRSSRPTRLLHLRAKREGWKQRLGMLSLGLWNPIVFTLASTLWHPFKRTITRVRSLLDIQFIVAALSLYLLSIDFSSPSNLLTSGFSTFRSPRYFTFAAILFTAFSLRAVKTHRTIPFWKMPRLWRAVFAVVLMEALSYYSVVLSDVPTLTRIGLALVLSELVTPMHTRWNRFFSMWIRWTCCLVVISGLVSIFQHTGAIDLAAAASEPKVHPSAIVLFTFLAGITLGFLSGNFPTAYFALFTLMLHSNAQPLVRAALLDGILAGMMLSPISLFTVLPAVQFGVPVQDIIRHRFKHLSIPLLIGLVIYFVASFNSVAILRPVTFVFLCLLFSAARLKRQAWEFGRTFRVFPDPSLGAHRGTT